MRDAQGERGMLWLYQDSQTFPQKTETFARKTSPIVTTRLRAALLLAHPTRDRDRRAFRTGRVPPLVSPHRERNHVVRLDQLLRGASGVDDRPVCERRRW
jgi:hypothetical protein